MSSTALANSIAVSGLILAGGEGRRMSGRDKGLMTLGNRPLVEYAIDCLTPLVDDLAISCNRNRALYADYHLPCLVDNEADPGRHFAGPMAGLATGLKYAKHDWLLVMPCDTPLMTTRIMAQLITEIAADTAELASPVQAVIFSYQGLQPLHGLYHKSMLPIFEQCLAENKNALQRLLRSLDSIKVLAAQATEFNFNNANDAEELSRMEKLLAQQRTQN